MGAQLCRHPQRLDSTQKTNPTVIIEPENTQEIDKDQPFQEFDNPNRGVKDYSFLKTEVVASNKILEFAYKPYHTNNIKRLQTYSTIPRLITPEHALQAPSFYRIESSEISYGKNDWDTVFDDQAQKKEPQAKEEIPFRKRKPSVQELCSVEDKNRTQISRSNSGSTIFQQVTDFVLSQKNLFEPISYTKESFIKFRKEEIEKHYSFVQKIGEGSFGNVYKVLHKASKQQRAIKILKKSVISKMQHNKIMKEINILKKLDHPHILKIFEVFLYKSNYYIVTEHCQGGSLSRYIRNRTHQNLDQIKTIFKQIASALSYMHNQGFIHRDLKPDNILLCNTIVNDSSENIDIRIIDFGLAKQMAAKTLKDREKVGTHTYMAPQVLEGFYSGKCDMWSAGVVLYYLIAGRNPFKGIQKQQTFELIKKKTINFSGTKWNNISMDIKVLLLGLLEKDQRKRISAEQALKNKWLAAKTEITIKYITMQDISKKIIEYNRKNNFISVIQGFLAYTANSRQKLQECSRIFSILDENQDGYLQRSELEKAFYLGSVKFSQVQIDYALDKVDSDHCGKLNYSQFITILSDRNQLFVKQSLIDAFRHLDLNNNGFLQKSELKQTLKSIDLDELSYIVNQFDQNEDQRISLQEFIEYLQQLPSNT